MTDLPSRPTRHAFERTRRLLDDFFKVDEYQGSFEQFDGTMGPPQRILVFERGDSVAALLYDPARKEVILVDQFRLPVALRAGGQFGWLLEPTAGIQPDTETVFDTAMREIKEETGYQVSSLTPIATFFPSPGGSTERIHLMFAEVRQLQQIETGGGVAQTGENIAVRRIGLTEFFSRLRNREFEDAKLIIGGYWLLDRLAAMPRHSGSKYPRRSWQMKLPEQRGWFGTTYTPQKHIGIVAGDIRKVSGVDVWINPLTSDMLLDKFTDFTISAAIRAAAARKYPDGQIREDVVGEELRNKLGGRVYVKQGMVLATSPGLLAKTNDVRQILHVSVAHGQPGKRPTVDLGVVESCVDNILQHVHAQGRHGSILIPLLGTGEGALRVSEVAPIVVQRSIAFFKAHPDTRLSHVHVLAYSDIDVDAVAAALGANKAAFETDPSADFRMTSPLMA